MKSFNCVLKVSLHHTLEKWGEKGFSAYCLHIYRYSTNICILITADWLLLNRGHTMRGRIYSVLIKMCYSPYAVFCRSMSREKYHLAKATNEGLLSVQLNNFSSVYM